MSYRDNLAPDGTPIQQGLTVDSRDYKGVYDVNRTMLGVVLEVYPSDNEEGNRSATHSVDRRGHTHACRVLVLDDGSGGVLTLSNVIIPPDHPSGVDDYSEKLPRGSSKLVNGEVVESGIDPYKLDGDMCIVSFLGGHLDRPYVSNWWPHAGNTYDPATSGRGNPSSTGEGRALSQERRYFRRVNGVETVITSEGDVIVSTTFAGSAIAPGEAADRGRFPRSEATVGGSVRVYIKPSELLEFVWDAQEDGVGVLDSRSDELPQPNPGRAAPTGVHDNTYILVDKDNVTITVPTSVKFVSQDEAHLEGVESATLTSDQTAKVSGTQEVLVQSDAGKVSISAATLIELISQAILNLTATGAITISSDGAVTIGAGAALALGGSTVAIGPAAPGGAPAGPGALSMGPGGVALGEGATQALVYGTALAAAWQLLLTTHNGVTTPATTPPETMALANANSVAIKAMLGGIAALLSPTSKTV